MRRGDRRQSSKCEDGRSGIFQFLSHELIPELCLHELCGLPHFAIVVGVTNLLWHVIARVIVQTEVSPHVGNAHAVLVVHPQEELPELRVHASATGSYIFHAKEDVVSVRVHQCCTNRQKLNSRPRSRPADRGLRGPYRGLLGFS